MQLDPETATALESLHDLALPAPVAWTPQTAGWMVLAGVAALGLARIALALHRRHQANRYRREALRALDVLERQWAAEADSGDGDRALAELPTLLKRAALASGRRSEVAGLAGSAWLRYLDRTYGGRGFSEGTGRLLPTLAYGSPAARRELARTEVTALFALSRTWLRRHRARV